MFNKKAIFVNTVSQVIVRVATLAFTLVSIKLLANYLGPVGVGNYNTITTYINFFIVIADLGLFAVAVREISKKPEDEKKIISNVFFIRLISASVATLIALLIVALTDYSKDIKLGTLIAAGFILFNLLSSVYDVVLQCRLKMQFSAIAEFISKLITLIALYLIIQFGGNFLAIISTVTISGLIIFILKWFFSTKFISFGIKYDKKATSFIFKMAWPLGIVFIVNNLFFKLDTLMLFIMQGAAAVGIYSVAYKVLEVTIFIAGYFASALKPTIAKEIIHNKVRLASIISKSIMVLLIIAAPISAIFIAYSQNIILFLSNADFINGSNALVLLSLTLPLIFLDILLGEILIGSDSRKLLIRISIFIIFFNLVANLFAIPRYSYMGAAATTLMSELLLLAINIHYTKKIIPYVFSSIEIIKIIIMFVLTLVFALTIKAFSVNFIVLMIISFLFYALLCQIFGVAKLSQLKAVFTQN